MKIITRLKDLGIEVETDMSKGEAIQLIFEALPEKLGFCLAGLSRRNLPEI